MLNPNVKCERSEIKSRKKLPKILPSAVCAQYVRCGKPGCRCGRGELHGPYYYCFWREKGKLRKAYVRKEDLEIVRSICQMGRNRRSRQREARESWRRLKAMIKQVEELLSGE